MNKKIQRRSFLNTLLNTGIVALISSIFYPVARFLIPPKNTEPIPTNVYVGTVGEIKPNSGKIFRFGRKPGILLRTPNGEIRAFTAICTHLDCTVQYREDFKHIWCACHNGHYDLQGTNIKGPPPRPLTRFVVNIKDDKIYVSKEA